MPLRTLEVQSVLQTTAYKIAIFCFYKKIHENQVWKALRYFFCLSTSSIKCGFESISKWTLRLYMYEVYQYGIDIYNS